MLEAMQELAVTAGGEVTALSTPISATTISSSSSVKPRGWGAGGTGGVDKACVPRAVSMTAENLLPGADIGVLAFAA